MTKTNSLSGDQRRRKGNRIRWHSAVHRAIKLIIAASDRQNGSVRGCGEEAGEGEFACLLIGLGIRGLIQSPNRAAAVRRTARQIRVDDLDRIAARALKCRTPQEVRDWCKATRRLRCPLFSVNAQF
ncbi:putative PEP-binding protein [Bremerella cremea]|uniref:putative PEP-binding protein n=1 Tax=Bremerella cremea TaxID=1031537 RepID=UPI00358DB5B3